MQGLSRRRFLEGSLAAAASLAAGPLGAAAVRAAETGDALGDLDATALAARVRQGEVTPQELLDAAIARIGRVDPELNAVVIRRFDEARAEAEAGLPDGPFRGVPFLLKNLIACDGVPLTYGSRFFAKHVADHTHAVAARFRRAGLVLAGSTNTPEFGLLPSTEPLLHGPTKNPWDLARSPGGSSGGAAAAVAAGIVPMAHASDGGGSIRIPASQCGVFGLKPSRGRHPQWPDAELLGLSVDLCVSRSVRDSAGLLDAIRGHLPGDRWKAAAPPRPYREAVGAPPGRLRVAFHAADFSGRAPHADCREAVEGAAELCESLGHRVEEARPPVDGDAFADAFLVYWAGFAGQVIQAATRRLGREPQRELFEPWTWALYERDRRRAPADLLLASQVVQRATYAAARFFEAYDVLLTPVLGGPPVPTGAFAPGRSYDELYEELVRYVAYTPLWNATGQPAMSVPLHWNAEGLPIGVHFAGRPDDEATLLRLAAQLEEARPWAGRRPPVNAFPG